MSTPFHLAWFGAGGFGVKSWGKTWSGTGGSDWAKPDLFVDLARSLERACFDYLIIEDSSYVPDAYGGNSKAHLGCVAIVGEPSSAPCCAASASGDGPRCANGRPTGCGAWDCATTNESYGPDRTNCPAGCASG